ncbi:MAG: FtsW/RodA/SpoVE family cell cycle protein [Lachnospiraceae bacterium]|nr:FtsW/RodA/SpoVE family cell cycle protein [Lachnospiraceae bacterium]
MLRAVIELSKYILTVNILLYTLTSYIVLRRDDRERKGFIFVLQYILILFNHVIGSLVLLSSRKDFTYLFLPLFQLITMFAFLVLMRVIYPRANRLIQNHIALLLSISFVILTRISLTRSIRQFAIVAISLVVALTVPAFMKYIKLLKRCEFIFAAAGILILGVVLISGSITNGSKLSFSIMGLSFQPSEFVKIIYVLFTAAILSRADRFIHIVISAALAAIHVMILVASKDLGSALIYFITYIILLFVATHKIRYLILGLAGGSAAAYVSYFLFAHVRVRVIAWLDPWNDIDATGYQIAQSLFGIGTGGWFGMGIDAGMPSSIPYVEQDFIFSAICEEFGVLFGICLIAVCVNLFLEIVHVAHTCYDSFMKYASYGLGIIYIVQLFLTIGGNSKFIPLTGVTLPLISYGGSSVLASLIMFSVIQGLYINNDLYYKGKYGTDDLYENGESNDTAEYDEYTEDGCTDTSALCMSKLQMNIVAGVFAGLFVAISGYLVHYVYFDSPQIINNSYNVKRQDILAAKTIRGDILSADGQVLATTLENTAERYYPFGDVFSHAVGYASHGRMGVEQSANMFLVSSNISLSSKLQNDLADEKHMGNTVVTTFDTRLQKIAYNAMGIYSGAVIVTEPSSGRILAMVSKPDFDPNKISDIWEDILADTTSSVLLNRVTQGLYPPGSTFKILTALEYIRENPENYQDYSFQCTGKFTNNGDTISCYHNTSHGSVDFTTSFAKSCNASFANIGLTLDRDQFRQTLDSLHFNSSLPVDFLANVSRISDELSDNDGVMLQTVIGQGTTQMTPIQIAMITAMIANNGEMMTPYMIDHIETADGDVIKQYEPTSLGQLITEQEAAALQELMSAVVQEGTGTRLISEEYSAAGKTGSAEFNDSSDSHAWFTGYTYDTEIPLQITVILEGAGSGGEYAVPMARRILDQYYGKN